ncbi:uncharacterized protein [Procambarus clarkii]|uniref:uncharacterized protein n=1 Tax=Procambarus clarkii TaxID=6728 RepID=UPI0037432607
MELLQKVANTAFFTACTTCLKRQKPDDGLYGEEEEENEEEEKEEKEEEEEETSDAQSDHRTNQTQTGPKAVAAPKLAPPAYHDERNLEPWYDSSEKTTPPSGIPENCPTAESANSKGQKGDKNLRARAQADSKEEASSTTLEVNGISSIQFASVDAVTVRP